MTASNPSVSHHTLRTPRTAHYACLGTPDTASTLWIVLHGYSERADVVIERMQSVYNPSTCIVAPEALSRFYVEGMSGRVGASWMTSAHRDDEIADYIAYLNRLHVALRKDGPPTIHTHVLGFSQGAATACRWVTHTAASIDRCTLWAGGVPPDLDLTVHADRLRALDLSLVRGTRDAYISSADHIDLQERLDAHRIPHTNYTFDGGHRLDTSTLKQLAKASVAQEGQ